MENTFDILAERGFIRQSTDEGQIRQLFDGRRPVCAYVGFDPTADSFHIGSLIPLMALAWMERGGHRPIVLMGGGTALLGDPAGRTDVRHLMSPEEIKVNIRKLKSQVRRFLNMRNGRSLCLNNAGWLSRFRFIDFMREVGSSFKVNVMVKAERCRARFENNGSMPFNEFSYPLLQAYDFVHLHEHHDCRLQMGGSDQWGNITDGIDLVRRCSGQAVHGITFPLLEIGGAKMGMAEKGMKIWLDRKKTDPYSFYQFWIQKTTDEQVAPWLKLFTFLPLDEISALTEGQGQSLNAAKSVLAHEVTRMVHSQRAADVSRRISQGLYGASRLKLATIARYAAAFVRHVDLGRLRHGVWPARLMQQTGLVDHVSKAKQLIAGGGGYLNRRKIASLNDKITAAHLNEDGLLLLQRGKKGAFVVVCAVNGHRPSLEKH